MTERFTVPVKYRFSHSKIQLNGKPLTNDELVRILNTNDGAFVENFSFKQENEQLKKELHKLKLVNEMLSMDFSNSEHELWRENEQLKEQLSEAKTDEKQLGISFMGYKMKLIEVLQKKYDKVKGKTLYADVYTEIAEEMGVDLE